MNHKATSQKKSKEKRAEQDIERHDVLLTYQQQVFWKDDFIAYPGGILEPLQLVFKFSWIGWKGAVIHFDREKCITLLFDP